jgi:hypothetical protein
MGNSSSTAAPPRSPALGSQPPIQTPNRVDPADAVYETYQVPLGLAKEINRMCSEFQRLQHAVQNGASLPPNAVFQLDLIQLLRLTNPQCASNPASYPANPSSYPANPAFTHSAELPPRHVENRPLSRDPSLPLILKLDKSQLLLLQEESGHSAFSNSGASLKSAYRLNPVLAAQADERYVAASAAPEFRARDRLAALAKTMNASNAAQPVWTQNSDRQQVSQQIHFGTDDSFSAPYSHSHLQTPGSEMPRSQLGYSASSYRSDLAVGSPRFDASSASLENSGLRSAARNFAPMSNRSYAGSVESQVEPVSAAPSNSRSRFLLVPEPGDMDYKHDGDVRVASETSSPNLTGSLQGSQSLATDDVEAKRRILAEVLRSFHLNSHTLKLCTLRFAVKSSKSTLIAESANQSRRVKPCNFLFSPHLNCMLFFL